MDEVRVIERESNKKKPNYCRAITDDYCVIDTETTGTSLYYDEVIEIGAIKVRNGEIVDNFNKLVKPKKRIPKSATDINHITNEMVKDAPLLEEIIREFISFIGEDILIGQNTSFDINILKNNANCVIDNQYVCIEQMVKKLWKLDNYRLDTVRKHFKIETEAHRALGDCEATNIIYKLIKDELLKRGKNIEEFFSHKNNAAKKIEDIIIDPNGFDESSPIYGHSFAFTGTLPFVRDEILEYVLKIGGNCYTKGAIREDTEYLVIGDEFYRSWKETEVEPSKKVKIALEKGIEILDSKTFLNMLNK